MDRDEPPPCSECRFWYKKRGKPLQKGAKTRALGECRRYPPAIGDAFPVLAGDRWCGEHEHE